MTCVYTRYKSFYWRSLGDYSQYSRFNKGYVQFDLNLKKIEQENTRIRINMMLRDEKCSCEKCNPYTGN